MEELAMSHDLLALFEQTAAKRAHASHKKMVLSSLHPHGHCLTDIDCAQMKKASIQNALDERRHKLWLDRRCRAAAIA